MLRQLDAGWEIFRLPGGTRRDGQRLGTARTRSPFPVNPGGACAVDNGAAEYRRPRPQPGWQEALRRRLAASGGIGPLRCEIKAVCAIPFGNLGDGARLLS